MEMEEQAKFCLYKQFLMFYFYMNNCKQVDNNWMINFFSGQDAIYFDVEMNVLLCLTYSFTLLVLFERDKLCY